MTKHLEVITNSEMRAFRRCPREHHYTYRVGLRSVRSAETLSFGLAWHAMLEAYWQTGALDRALACMGTVEPFTGATLTALAAGYHVHWGPTGRTLAVEAEFRAPLRNPATGYESQTYQIGGKLDAIAEINGQHWLVEHKTTSEDCYPGTDYVAKLRLDSQISTYYHGARSLGYEPVGALYDVVRKPTIRPRKNDTPELWQERLAGDIAERPYFYFQRHTVVRLDNEEREAAADAWHTARIMRESELESRAPKNPDSCVRYGRYCDYFGLCTGAASPDDPMKFRRSTTKHEELSREETGVSARLHRHRGHAGNHGEPRS